ncbi:hypothetical protein Tco_0339764 [Tanacetum coccineum]
MIDSLACKEYVTLDKSKITMIENSSSNCNLSAVVSSSINFYSSSTNLAAVTSQQHQEAFNPNNVSPSADTTAPSKQELDLLFGPLYDGFFTAGTSSVNKSSSPTDNSTQQDAPPTTNIQSSTEPTTPTTNVNAEENNDNQAADTQFQHDECINPFYTPVREVS